MKQYRELHNENIEMALIDCMLTNSDMIDEMIMRIRPEYLTSASVKKIYDKIIKRHKQGYEINHSTVIDIDDLRSGFKIGGLTTGYFYAVNYAREIKDLYNKRRLYETSHKFITDLPAYQGNILDGLAEYQSHLEDILRDDINMDKGTIKEALIKLDKRMAVIAKLRAKRQVGDIIGFSTGISAIDKITAGILPQTSWCIGAYTSTGKTTLALVIKSELIDQNANTVYCAVEDTVDKIMAKLLAVRTGIHHLKIISDNLHPDEREIIEKERARLAERNNTLIIKAHTIDEIYIRLRQIAKQMKVDVVFIDYVQALRGDREMFKMMKDIAFKIPVIIDEIGCSVISTSQIDNQTQREGQHTQLIAFKGGGDMAAASDISIMLIKNDKRNKLLPPDERRHLIAGILKNRDFKTGVAYLEYNSEWTKIMSSIKQEDDKSAVSK